MNRMFTKHGIGLLMISLLLPVLTWGQGLTTASMSGRVMDQEGNPLVGATVVAVHAPSGSTYGNNTNENGSFRIPNMRVGGPYNVKVTYVGYDPYVEKGINLSLGQTYQLSAELSASGVTVDAVEITSTSGIFDPNRTGAETVVSEEQINTLPTVARAIGDFTRLTPQATVREGSDGFSISLAGQNNRYNAIYIDGAVNNDVFGLAGSGTNGGQTGVSPISLDAVEEFQIQLAPYDVRVGGFAGGAINIVTRSGTNNLEASAYHYFRNEGLAGRTPTDIGAERERLPDFTASTSGFRVGGPIVKDKLFFFVNAEIQREEIPQPFDFDTYEGDATRSDIDALVDKLQNQYGYDPGQFDNNPVILDSDKINVKLDWNINQDHKLSVRYGYVFAENIEAVRSSTRRIRFYNESESFLSTTQSAALELNSVFGSNLSNNFKINFTSVRDDRDPTGENFPYVSIDDGLGSISFGSEQFSTANQLDQDILTFTDNFEIYNGAHTFTIGTHNEFYSVYNLFIRQNFGVYNFNDSLGQFLNDMMASQHFRSYSLVDDVTGDGSEAAAEFTGGQLGLYVQDDWQVNPNLKVSFGLRADVPFYNTDTRANANFNDEAIGQIEAVGYDLRGAQTGTFIDPQIMLSPRIGFNFSNPSTSTQVRGGVGIFTSRLPLVWPGGAYLNNGFTVGGYFTSSPQPEWAVPYDGFFDPDWQNQPQDVLAGGGEPSGQIDLFAEDFKLPQVIRANVAVDQDLIWGFIGTLELLYTKDLNAAIYQNVNLKPATEFLTGTPDDRPIYDQDDPIVDTYDRVLLAYNTNLGYGYNASFSLNRPFENGFTATAAYSYGDSYSVLDGTSSQNSSQWRGLHAVDGRNFSEVPADMELSEDAFEGYNTVSRSAFAQGHRVIAGFTYEIPLGRVKDNKNSLTMSLFYEGAQGAPFSYVYGDGDELTNEDSRNRELIYIPNEIEEVTPANISQEINFVGSADEQVAQWNALNAYIEDDPYLSQNRGEYAERNSNWAPWSHVVDLRLLRDFTLVGNNGKEHTFQVSVDVFNFTNLLNKNWGRRYFVSSSYNLIEFEGFQADGTTPEFSFEAPIDNDPSSNNIDDSGIQSSRWQAQLGLRYLFN